MKWNEMKWNEMKWNEIKSNQIKSNQINFFITPRLLPPSRPIIHSQITPAVINKQQLQGDQGATYLHANLYQAKDNHNNTQNHLPCQV